MSYEGYTQLLCPTGHYFEKDCNDSERTCPECGQKACWENSVDDTNCEQTGLIPLDRFTIRTLAKTKMCDMGHEHRIEPPTYHIPSLEETAHMRCLGE